MEELFNLKTCYDCKYYIEETAGSGYCSEWDTIVELNYICLDEIYGIEKEKTNE